MGYDEIITPRGKEGLVMTFGLVDAKKVDMLYTDNLILCLNIANYILKIVLNDLAADVSILYKAYFIELGLLFINVESYQFITQIIR